MFAAFYFKPDKATMVERHKISQILLIGEVDVSLGQIYPAKTRVGAKPFTYLRVAGKSYELLGQITEQDAKKAGYPHIPAFKKDWKHKYGGWDSRMLVTVVDFEMVAEAEYLNQRLRKGAA